MKKFTLLLTVLTFCFVLAFGGVALAGKACPSSDKQTTATTISAKDGDQVAVLNVSNMTCGGCVSQVTTALKGIDGVSDVSVSLENGTAKVSYKADKVEINTLTAAIVKAGFPAVLSDGKVAGSKAHAGCDPAQCSSKDKSSMGCGMTKEGSASGTMKGCGMTKEGTAAKKVGDGK